MLFNTVEYALFLATVVVVFWSLRERHTIRSLFLVLSSAAFYTRFDYGPRHPHLGWAYLAVLLVSATLDFFLAQAIARVDRSELATRDPAAAARRRKQLLIVSVVYNLGVLAWFKYTGFAIDTARDLLAFAGIHLAPRTLSIILPIGISFFTFETMSYTIDVYRRELEPLEGRRAFLDYLLFISFFPHLVAGPIIRPRHMLPQLRARPTLDAARASDGFFMIAVGLLKKVVIADYLALNHVDRVFDRPDWFSGPECLAAVYGYALQIYCDFSGYTDIAIGSALLLGVVLPKNFDAPYTSRDLQEFWRRWHISLSSWLRDYLYIPLGGSKDGELATYRNLMITMLLGGLWHGASWNFVVWGAMHGVALAVVRMVQRRRDRMGIARSQTWPARLLGVALTFHYVCVAWIFFRAEGFARARAMLHQIAFGGLGVANLPRKVVLVLLLGAVTHAIPDAWEKQLRMRFAALPAVGQGGVLFAVAWVLRTVGSAQVVPFVYFQF